MSPDFLQQFVTSLPGQLILAGIILLLFLGILLSGRKKKADTRAMVVSALLVALSIALNQLVLFRMPQGGSVTAFSMLPIVLCACLLGVRRGLMAGISVGLLDLLFNPYVVHPVQLLLDYPLSFGALALSGLIFAGTGKLIPSYLFGLFCRYCCVVLSGIIFFGMYAPEGFNAVTWSLWYNVTYLGAEGIFTVILLAVPAFRNAFFRIRSRL